MPFNIDHQPSFERRVIVTMPDGSDEDFNARFRVRSVTDFASLNMADGATVAAFFQETIVSVDDVVNAAGEPVPSSPGLIARLLDMPLTRQALFLAYVEGVGSSTQKN